MTPEGAATGVAGLYNEMTLGLIYKPKPWLWFRPEARYDWTPYSQALQRRHAQQPAHAVVRYHRPILSKVKAVCSGR